MIGAIGRWPTHCVTYTKKVSITAQPSDLLFLCKCFPIGRKTHRNNLRKNRIVSMLLYSSRCSLLELQWSQFLFPPVRPPTPSYLLTFHASDANCHVNAARSAGCYLLSKASNLNIPNGPGVVVAAGVFLYCYLGLSIRYAMWGIKLTRQVKFLR